MNKKQNIQKYFNQKEKLTLKNKVYFNQTKRYLINCLNDDLGDKGDITSNTLIKDNPKTRAIMIAKQDGIIAGLEEIQWLIDSHKLKAKSYKKDGKKIKKGQTIITITGGIKDILKIERTILNLLQRMSGIATETAKFVKLSPNTLICSTRKTPLGLLDKKAVTVGGGGTHRLGLHDWILIKDNHLKISDSKFQISNFYEIEVENEKQFKHFLQFNPGAIMLDNFKASDIKKLLKKYHQLIGNTIIEASGGINKDNIKKYSQIGVDIISLGYLTHSTKALDISLEIL